MQHIFTITVLLVMQLQQSKKDDNIKIKQRCWLCK